LDNDHQNELMID